MESKETSAKTPAEVVHEKLGVRPTAKYLRINPSSVSRWKTRNGTVPEKYHKRIMNLARMKKIRITKKELKG